MTNIPKYLLLWFIWFNVSCRMEPATTISKFGTESDSARYYFNLGWHEILANGRWTESETAFRKSTEIDPDFLLGQCLVGRISHDANERHNIYESITSSQYMLQQPERKLLNCYMNSIRLMNARSQNIEITKEERIQHRDRQESSFRAFTLAYPDEPYIKAEYIEVLHARYGPAAALDSINKLATAEQLKNPFYIGYVATLESEIGNIEVALDKVKELQRIYQDPTMPNQYVILAEIYERIDKLNTAKEYIDKAVGLDARHLIALGIQNRITKKLKVERQESKAKVQ